MGGRGLAQAARMAALKAKQANAGSIPSYPGMCRRVASSTRLVDQAGGSSPTSPAPISPPTNEASFSERSHGDTR